MKRFPLLQSGLLFLHPRLQMFQKSSLGRCVFQRPPPLHHMPDSVESVVQKGIASLHLVSMQHDAKPLLVANPVVCKLALDSICISLRHSWSLCSWRIHTSAYALVDVVCFGVQCSLEFSKVPPLLLLAAQNIDKGSLVGDGKREQRPLSIK